MDRENFWYKINEIKFNFFRVINYEKTDKINQVLKEKLKENIKKTFKKLFRHFLLQNSGRIRFFDYFEEVCLKS